MAESWFNERGSRASRPAGTARRRMRDARRGRRGAALVEFALVAPLIFFFTFAAVEFGRALFVMHGLDEASRAACRAAVMGDHTSQDVEKLVDGYLRAYGISDYKLKMTPKAPEKAFQWDPVQIEVTVKYGRVSWLPSPAWMDRIKLRGGCTLPHESERFQRNR